MTRKAVGASFINELQRRKNIFYINRFRSEGRTIIFEFLQREAAICSQFQHGGAVLRIFWDNGWHEEEIEIERKRS